ncbi:MAG: hypothetical protein IKG61_10320, partial [Selenomonadaceae bacterium]|nr:hypothetical protein [Selenomonadaceae bacterium]
SENILNLEEAGDYERLLVENVQVIGTKAITKSGYIQGKVTEVFVGDGGKIEKCEITKPDESIEEVTADQISIFGKQVTVIDVDREKKNNLNEQPAFEPVFEAFSQENESKDLILSTDESLESSEANTFSATEEFQSIPELTLPPKEEPETTEEKQAELESVMTPDPAEQPSEQSEEQPVEQPAEQPSEQPVEQPVEEKPSEEDKKIAAMTQQAEDLKAALQKARKNQQTPPEQKPMLSQKKQVEKAVDERRRRVLLGKHATKTITAESGTVVVEEGAEVTEEVLQRARLSNKFIELSMNVQ